MAEIQYAIAGNLETPGMLARLRWSDICESITAKNPVWTTDRTCFDWLWESDGMVITEAQAKRIANEWGATLPK